MTRPQLIVTTRGTSTRIDVPDAALTIGRHPANGLCVHDDRLSRRHCVLEPDQGHFKLFDVGSRNGIRFAGQRLAWIYLKSGEAVKIGHSLLQFVWPSQPSQLPEPRYQVMEASPVQAAPEPATAALHDALDDILEPVAAEPVREEPSPIYNYPEALARLQQMSTDLPKSGFDATQVILKTTRRTAIDAGGAELGEGGGSLLRLILTVGIQATATDLHIEPRADCLHIRMRVDGMLAEVMKLDLDAGRRLLGVVKVLCEIDIARRQVVQEGHFSIALPDRPVDYRVSFTPAVGGQKLVMRVLDTANSPQHIAELGLPKPVHDQLRTVTHRDSGMVLVCGPTGSGKTTTLYAILRDLDLAQRNVVTIEDPVEYQVEGITQMPVNEQMGNTFAALLRSVLRQDPDVILLGEIRDAETARIAVQAAMTGHLVLTTVHARDSVGTVFRLMDLGVEPHMIATALNLVISQRLVRQLCPHCKRPVSSTAADRKRLGDAAAHTEKLYRPEGCARCLGTGYLGRRGIYELLANTTDVRDVLGDQPTMAKLREAMGRSELPTLTSVGAKLVTKGFTSLAELDRAVGLD
jgi:general secretion pathway protein E